jgi:YD repeat-containing protein
MRGPYTYSPSQLDRVVGLSLGGGANIANTYDSYDALGRITNRAIKGVSQQLTYDALDRRHAMPQANGSFGHSSVGGLGSQNFSTRFGNGRI